MARKSQRWKGECFHGKWCAGTSPIFIRYTLRERDRHQPGITDRSSPLPAVEAAFDRVILENLEAQNVAIAAIHNLIEEMREVNGRRGSAS